MEAERERESGKAPSFYSLIYNCLKKNTIQYNTTSLISNIEHNNITPTICSQHWDGWKGGGQKNILIVVHPQSGAVYFLFKRNYAIFIVLWKI